MPKPRAANQVRIIAGDWRGRKITFPDHPGLRPTSDRVRETLFNWLQPHLQGARCLDLFAGSGALGFEAASRGAKQVTLVEQNAAVVAALTLSQQQLNAQTLSIMQGDAFEVLTGAHAAYDIIFVDPPFQLQRLSEICTRLQAYQWVHADSLVYIECAATQIPVLPQAWQIIKNKQAGNVGYYLVDCKGD